MAYLQVPQQIYNISPQFAKMTSQAIAVATNEEEVPLLQGIGMQAVFGTGLSLVGAGFTWGMSRFQPKAQRDAAAAQRKAEMQALKGRNFRESFRNAYRYQDLTHYTSKIPREIAPLSQTELAQLTDAQRNKYLRNSAKAQYFDRSRTLLEEAKNLRGKAQKLKIKELEKEYARAKYNVHKAKYKGNLKPTGFWGKLWNGVKTVTGLRALNGTRLKLLANSKALRWVAKCSRGALPMIILTLGMEAISGKFSEVKNAAGTGAMMKEIAKSTGVAAIEAVGWAAGAKVGSAIGAMVGTTIPVLGTIVGGALGAVIGGGLSYLAGHFARKRLESTSWGKSELAKHNETQEILLRGKLTHSSETLQNAVIVNEAKQQEQEMLANATEEERKALGVTEEVDKNELAQAREVNKLGYYSLYAKNPQLFQETLAYADYLAQQRQLTEQKLKQYTQSQEATEAEQSQTAQAQPSGNGQSQQTQQVAQAQQAPQTQSQEQPPLTESQQAAIAFLNSLNKTPSNTSTTNPSYFMPSYPFQRSFLG